MSKNRLAWLFQRYFDRVATEQDKDELIELLGQARNDEEIQHLIAAAWNQLETEKHFFTPDQSEKILSNILQGDLPSTGATVVPVRRFTLPRVAVAAAVIFLFGAATYLLIPDRPKKERATAERSPPPVTHEIRPGTSKAILTLADGSTITLDSSLNGTLTRQGNVKIVKLKDGRLIYNPVDQNPSAHLYNSISTPAGGQYQLVLSDGSKVWLNAASTLRFPAAFDGKQREVEITGEVYFEIKKNAAMPFRVKAGDAVVEVLGTSFNIMAYTDESAIKATLLEGAVRVSKGSTRSLLQPGQEAALNRATSAITVKAADVDEAVAWKNGLFEFNSDDIGTIMRQLGRWYDVETSYESKIPDGHYTGAISRNIPLSQVLKMLEVNDLHFRIEGKKIIVL